MPRRGPAARQSGCRPSHRRRTVHELPQFLLSGDLIVANDSATLPAALTAVLTDTREIAFHLSTQLSPDVWVVEPRRSAVTADERLVLPGRGAATLLTRHPGRAALAGPARPAGRLARATSPLGQADRLPVRARPPGRSRRYQTVYAASRAPPRCRRPAGPFSPAVLARWLTRGRLRDADAAHRRGQPRGCTSVRTRSRTPCRPRRPRRSRPPARRRPGRRGRDDGRAGARDRARPGAAGSPGGAAGPTWS